MGNDRAFMMYAMALMTGLAAVLSALVLTEIATPPSTGVFLEHLALGVTVRGAYKSFGGFDWIQSAAQFAGVITEGAAAATHTGSGAEAMG